MSYMSVICDIDISYAHGFVTGSWVPLNLSLLKYIIYQDSSFLLGFTYTRREALTCQLQYSPEPPMSLSSNTLISIAFVNLSSSPCSKIILASVYTILYMKKLNTNTAPKPAYFYLYSRDVHTKLNWRSPCDSHNNLTKGLLICLVSTSKAVLT